MLWIRNYGGVIEISGGLNFRVTLWLYAVLLIGSIVMLAAFATWLARRLNGID